MQSISSLGDSSSLLLLRNWLEESTSAVYYIPNVGSRK
jgi:hypothetical protein